MKLPPLFARCSIARRYSLQALWRAGTDLLVPPVCPRCQLQAIDPRVVAMCPECQQALVQDVAWLCQRCGAFSHPYSHHDGKCADCRYARHRFDLAIALGAYDGPLRTTIVRMKQSLEQSLTYGVGQLLGSRAIMLVANDPPDVLCAVPMHWVRRIGRQVSSADTVARSVAKRMRLPYANRLVRCARPTQKQSLLSHDARRQNVAGAFDVRSSTIVEGRHVAVVDDIMTTGSTMDEIARMLKKRGARRVTAMVAARAARQSVRIRSSRK